MCGLTGVKIPKLLNNSGWQGLPQFNWSNLLLKAGPPLKLGQVTQDLSRGVLKAPKDGELTCSLADPFQCSITSTMKIVLLTSSWNHHCCSTTHRSFPSFCSAGFRKDWLHLFCNLPIRKLKQELNTPCSLFCPWAELTPIPFPYSCSTRSGWEGVPTNEIWDQTPGTAYNAILDRSYQLLADLRQQTIISFLFFSSHPLPSPVQLAMPITARELQCPVCP